MRKRLTQGPADFPAQKIVREHWAPFANQKVSRQLRRQLKIWSGPMIVRQSSSRVLKCLANCQETLDWVNLDLGGSVLDIGPELREIARRLRLDRAPRLGLSSLAASDRDAWVENTIALSLWRAIDEANFYFGQDLERRDRELLDSIPKKSTEPSVDYLLAHELAASLLILRTFGGRVYDQADARPAQTFRDQFVEFLVLAQDRAREQATKTIKDPRQPEALILTELLGLSGLVDQRMIPIQVIDRARFVYRLPNRRWRWTWYFHFAAGQRPISLSKWTRDLLTDQPPLHVIDPQGAVIDDHGLDPCRFCPRRKK